MWLSQFSSWLAGSIALGHMTKQKYYSGGKLLTSWQPGSKEKGSRTIYTFVKATVTASDQALPLKVSTTSQ